MATKPKSETKLLPEGDQRPDSLDRMLQRRGAFVEKRRHEDALFQLRIDDLLTRVAHRREVAARHVGVMDEQIAAILGTIRRDTGANSWALPSGTVYFQAPPEKTVWPEGDEAEDALIAWCEANLPDAVRVQKAVDKAAVKRHVKATGELPPGVDTIPGDEQQERLVVKSAGGVLDLALAEFDDDTPDGAPAEDVA